MIKSIRQRLHFWYGSVFTLALLIFGSLVYWRADREAHDRAVAQAITVTRYIDVSLRANEYLPADLTSSGLPLEFQFRRPIPRNPGGPNRMGTGAPRNSERMPARPAMEDDLEPLAPPDSSRSQDRPPMDPIEFMVKNSMGTVIASSPDANSLNLSEEVPTDSLQKAPIVRFRRNIIYTQMLGPGGTLIRVARPMDHDHASLHRFGYQIAGIGIATLIVGLVGGSWISRRMVKPIQQIAQTASQISAQSLDCRIETSSLDRELKPLAEVLNQTFGRLESSFQKLNQFTADASHELRTPLAVIQSQVELSLSQPRSIQEYQSTLATCLRASERMRTLVDGLLMLARADVERLEFNATAIDLRSVVEEAVLQLNERSVDAGIELECITPEEAVTIQGDATLLSQVPMNLIENAIRYTPRGGSIHVELRVEEPFACLSVRDTGRGISPDDQTHLFERFYRVDESRSRQMGGNGLGLAICKTLLNVHQGSIQCQSKLGQGTEFLVRIPLSNPNPKR